MKKIIALAAAATTLAFGATAVQAESAAERGEARIAEMLEGRVSGEPVDCISAIRSNDLKVIPHVGITYERGDTVYLARAKNPNSLRSSDVPVFERFGTQLCTSDVIRTVDRHAEYVTGVVFLEPFVPYTRAG